MKIAKYSMFSSLWLTLLSILLCIFVCPSTGSMIRDTQAANAVHVLFGFNTPESGIFPTDIFTVADGAQKTGLRVNLPLPDCGARPSDCSDLALINALDGFNLQPLVTIPFDGDIDPASVNSADVFFVELGDADVRRDSEWPRRRRPRVIGVNQLVWDPASHVLAVESDEQLKQHTRYALIVTSGVRAKSGAPIEASMAFRRFAQAAPYDLFFGNDDLKCRSGLDYRLNEYRKALIGALKAARGIGEGGVVSAGLFTTQSATASLERIRDQIKAATPEPASFLLGPGGARTVFSVSSIQAIDWQQQIKANPPAFQSFKPQFPGETSPLLSLDQYKPGAVGRIAYGSFKSPRYISDEPFMPPVGARAGVPPVQEVDTVYVNIFLPAGVAPTGGWPVVIFGLGGGAYKEESPWLTAAAFASHGMATACINVVGQAYGPLSFLKVSLKDGSVVQFPSGGRGKDLNGDGIISDNEGVSAVSPEHAGVGARDAIRQQVIDFMQLVRVIEIGADVDGDGVVDLDPSQISYFGYSFGGGAFGNIFLAVEPNVKVGVLASPGGLNSRPDLLRMRPSARAQVGRVLDSRVPSLLNSPGLTEWGGIPVTPPYFNENIPLRNQPIVTDHVDGAMDIQKYFDRVAWISNSGDGAPYAPHIRKDPLTGVSPKAILINFGKGDLNAPNPRTTQLLRAGGYADAATYYRNDLAIAEDTTVFKDPHTYLFRWMLPGLSGPIGRGGLEQVAIFLASRAQIITHPEPARFFETPLSLPLPEDFSYIP